MDEEDDDDDDEDDGMLSIHNKTERLLTSDCRRVPNILLMGKADGSSLTLRFQGQRPTNSRFIVLNLTEYTDPCWLLRGIMSLTN